MSPLALSLERPKVETIRFSLDPARNALASMILLIKDYDMPGLSDWVAQTRSRLSPDELFRHELVTIGFYYVIAPQGEWTSFEEYLNDLSRSEPPALKDKLLKAYALVGTTSDMAVDWKSVLASSETYVDFLVSRFGEGRVNRELETEAYQYVMDPPAMKKLLVDHLRWFWDNHLAVEWKRVLPMVSESVHAFQEVDFSGMDRMGAIRFVTGQDLEEMHWKDMLEKAEQITFIPSAHLGPYVTKMPTGNNSIAVLFGARQPENATVRIPDLDRADIVARLAALADDTRLHILQIIIEKGESRAQDIIETTGLSQPSVSRYLTQLAATGYLQERRIGGAKVYALNRDRIEKTLKAVSAFLLGRS